MFESFTRFLGFGSDTPAPVMPQQPIPAPEDTTMPPAAADVPFDLVGSANLVLGRALAGQVANKRMVNPATGQERWMDLAMPVESIKIAGPKAETNGPVFIGGQAAHETAVLTLNLRDAVGNYDLDSINRGLHAVHPRVPGLSGKLEPLKPLAVEKMDHEDVWKQLQPLLTASGKFKENEIGAIKQYFDTHKEMSTEHPDWSHLNVAHADGKVQIKIRPASIEGDDKHRLSGESLVVKYFEEHKDKILAKMREKIGSFMSAEHLAELDFTVGIRNSDWGDMPTVEFGGKAMPPATELGKNPLAELDTDKVAAIFKEAMIEADTEIPSIFGRIADGDMVRHIVRHRLGDAPAVHKVLDHPMFNSEQEQKIHERDVEKRDLIKIPGVAEGDKPNELTVAFNLPHGMDLTGLREAIARNAPALQASGQSRAA